MEGKAADVRSSTATDLLHERAQGDVPTHAVERQRRKPAGGAGVQCRTAVSVPRAALHFDCLRSSARHGAAMQVNALGTRARTVSLNSGSKV